jgi:hypothetical protein
MRFARVLEISLAVMLASSVAVAQQPDVNRLAERLNKKAMEDYDSLEFDSARQTLLSAIAKLRDAGQDETPAAAKVYVSLGMVYISGFKDRNRGIQQFVDALKIDGDVKLDPERATPELQEAFDEAVKQVGDDRGKLGAHNEHPDNGTPDGNEKHPDNGEVHGLQHNPVDESKAGVDVIIKAQLGSDVAASRLFLFYRGGGQEDYILLPMHSGASGDWVATIPGDVVQGKTVQYYIEARDQKNRAVVASGSASSPYIISVLTPTKEPNANPCAGLTGDAREKCEDPLGYLRKHPPTDRGYGRVFVNLMLGTGVGIEPAGNQYEMAYQYKTLQKGYEPLSVVQTGVALSPLHGAFEVGLNINRHIALSLVARIEGTLINNADASDAQDPPMGLGVGSGTKKASAAPAGMLRIRYNFGEGRLRPSLHVGIGGGYIRHVLNISDAENDQRPLVDKTTADYYKQNNLDPYGLPNGNPPLINEVCAGHHTDCWDNIAIGYVLLGAGGSLSYDLVTFRNGGIGVIGDLSLITAFGDQFGLEIDLSVGIGAHFM